MMKIKKKSLDGKIEVEKDSDNDDDFVPVNEKKTIRVLLSSKGKTQLLLVKFNNSTSWRFPEYEVNPKDNMDYIIKQIENRFLKIPLVSYEKKFKSKLINISYNYDKYIKKNRCQNKLVYQYVIVYTNHRVLDHLNFDSYEWIPWSVAVDYFKMRNDSNHSVLNEAISYLEYYYGIFNSKVHDDVRLFLEKITYEEYKKIRHLLFGNNEMKVVDLIKEKIDNTLKDLPLILKNNYLENQSIFIYNKLSNLILRSG